MNTAACNKKKTVPQEMWLQIKEGTCKVTDLKHSLIGCCYLDRSESICPNISNKFTI